MVDATATDDRVSTMSKSLPLSEQFREAVRASGLSLRTLEREAEVDRGALSRLLNGHRMISWEAADRLAALLGLEIRTRRRARRSNR
jgi:transcriptional regulator with XRE-family HTH domain